MNIRVPSMTPSISDLEVEYVTDAVRNGWGNKRSDYLDALSAEISDLVNLDFCTPVSHGTSGLQLALHALEVGAGDEVIVPDLTWVASASPIVHLGAKPVFVDVDETMCVNASHLRSVINQKTKAMVIVDLVGSAPKWDEIRTISEEMQIPVIEDATESIGSKYQSKAIGSLGALSVFSFNATKLTMSGQGGAVCTDSPTLNKRIQSLMHHGIDTELSGKYYWSNELGYNYQMSNMQAAMALAQMQRIDELIEFKRKSRQWYLDRFSGTALEIVPYPRDVDSNAWMTVGIIDSSLGIQKEDAVKYFQLAGIDLRPFFYRLSDMPTFATYGRSYDLSDSQFGTALERFGICLPYGYDLTIDQVEYVFKIFKTMCKEGI